MRKGKPAKAATQSYEAKADTRRVTPVETPNHRSESVAFIVEATHLDDPILAFFLSSRLRRRFFVMLGSWIDADGVVGSD